MKDSNKFRKNDLTDQEADALFQPLVRAKFDRERRARWTEKLAEQHQVHRQAKSSRPRNNLRFILALAAAAAIALLLIVNPFAGQRPGTDLTALADPYLQAEPFPNVLIRKGPAEERDALRNQLAEAYSKQQYVTAIAQGEELLARQQADVWDVFYLSLSYLYANQPEPAIRYLDQAAELSRTTNGDFQQEIPWFQALAYLKAGRADEARATLAGIGPEDWQYAAAQELLREIGRGGE